MYIVYRHLNIIFSTKSLEHPESLLLKIYNSNSLTLSPTANGCGSVGVVCFVDSLILVLSNLVVGVRGGVVFPALAAGEGPLFFTSAMLGGERSLVDLGLAAACWFLPLSNKLGLVLCECETVGGSSFTGELRREDGRTVILSF